MSDITEILERLNELEEAGDRDAIVAVLVRCEEIAQAMKEAE